MLSMALQNDKDQIEVTYGIYTIERLPKGSRRTPKWDSHSTAIDKATAEIHAKTLAAQPYFNHVEVQEFRICPITHDRSVTKIRSYSRTSSKLWGFLIIASVAILTAFVLS